LSPALDRHPVDVLRGSGDNRLPPACLPNRFLAVVRDDPEGARAETLAACCVRRCRASWQEIGAAVRTGLAERYALGPGWDRLWDQQVASFFEITTAVLPGSAGDEATLRRLLGREFHEERPHKLWWGRLALVARLLEAKRSAGHFPPYHVEGEVPQKCTLLGSYEQMGPARPDESRVFWDDLAHPDRNWDGTQTRASERLCAVSLIKRFAWPAVLSHELGVQARAGYYRDTATVAAACWLAQEPELNPIAVRRDGDWSGQWLHWPARVPRRHRRDPDADHDPSPPPGLWEQIRAKRASPQGRAPAYLAILMLDGDHMGRWLRGAETPSAGPELNRAISGTLARFARDLAPGLVAEHRGELVYAGGDDVLALLPTVTVLACARALNDAYRSNWTEGVNQYVHGPEASLSGGIAVVHFKEDLRFALQQARDAEKAVKARDRDALALTVCRRSGEHTTVLVPWGLVARFQQWVQAFIEGASDRWLYALQAELPTLRGAGLPWDAIVAEVRRLAGRAEDQRRRIAPEEAVGLLTEYRAAMAQREPAQTAGEVLADFLTWGQSASFVARGRD
jgi:CRISPR-associated protein Cmr2